MKNGVTDTIPGRPAAFSTSQERVLVLLLCCSAAVHVFIFSAAFPFFNNVDEQMHFDLAVKYSQGHVPRSLERVTPEATPYAVIYGSHEFVGHPANFPVENSPPPWNKPMEKIGPDPGRARGGVEPCRQPRSFAAAAYYRWRGWLAGGKALGLHDGFLLYWLRVFERVHRCRACLAWVFSGRAFLVFPERRFLRLAFRPCWPSFRKRRFIPLKTMCCRR